MKLHLYVDSAEVVRNALYNHVEVLKKKERTEAVEAEMQEAARLIMWLNDSIKYERD